MFKKLMMVSSMLALTTSVAMANPAPYVGAGMGVVVNTSSNNSFGNFRGSPLTLFAGYGGIVGDAYYLAGEFTGTVGTFELSNHGSLRNNYGYGVSVLPGLLLSDHTFAFARLGVVRAHFSDVKLSTSHRSSMETGGQVGLGVQTGLTQHVDLRGEYDYTAFTSLHGDNVSGKPNADVVMASLIYKFD